MSTTTEQPIVTATGDTRVDFNLRALATAIVESPLIASFITAVDDLNAVVSLTGSVVQQTGMCTIARPETFMALHTLSELNKIRQTYIDDKKEMLQEFSSVTGENLRLVLLHHFTPMGDNTNAVDIKRLPPAIEIWVRPDTHTLKFEAVRKAISEGHLVTNPKAATADKPVPTDAGSFSFLNSTPVGNLTMADLEAVIHQEKS